MGIDFSITFVIEKSVVWVVAEFAYVHRKQEGCKYIHIYLQKINQIMINITFIDQKL